MWIQAGGNVITDHKRRYFFLKRVSFCSQRGGGVGQTTLSRGRPLSGTDI